MPSIQDGTGKGYSAKVNARSQVSTYGVTDSQQRDATERGRAFNISTGEIALTGTADNAILYLKNNEPPENGDSDIAITAIVVGIGTRSATITDLAKVTIIRNPTAGTIVSGASAASIKSNSNFGSSFTLDPTTLVYKGATGNTFTDGTDHAILYTGDGRLYASLDILIPKGSSIGVKLDLNTSGGANVYCALICHRKDGTLV